MSEEPIDYAQILADVRGRRPSARNVVASALVGGAVFLAIEMLGRAVAPRSAAFTTPERIASLLLAEDVARASPGGLIVLALVLHAMLSITYGMILCLAVRHLSVRPALIGGAVFGVALYVVNHHALAPVFPAFAAPRGPVPFVAHLAFGLATVGTSKWLSHRRRRALAVTAAAGT